VSQLEEGLTLTTQTYEVNGLTGQLAKYNGSAARCYHGTGVDGEPSPTWHFLISDKLCLALPRRFLRELSEFDYPVVAVSGWQAIMQNDERAEKKGNQTTSNNRKDVRTTADSLVMQLRNVLIERGGGGEEGRKAVGPQQIKDLFGEMDSNHNGQLDKKEFLDGCLNIGITISPPEINLMWPLFDLDGNGFIDTDELSAFLEDRRTGRKTSMDMKDISKQLRKDRILNKTAYAARLKIIVDALRERILVILANERITKEELFLRLDLDCGGTLDRSEFLGGLRRLGIPLSLPDMNLLWPMFSLDADGDVSMHEWQKFLDTKGLETWWSYRITGDLFTTNMQMAPSGLSTNNLTAVTVQPQLRRGGGTSVTASAPKHRKPKTTAAERAVLYALPVSPRVNRFKEREWQVEAAVHAPKPPRGTGRRHHAHRNADTDNRTHGRGGHGKASLPQLSAMSSVKPNPPPKRAVTAMPLAIRNTRRCVCSCDTALCNLTKQYFPRWSHRPPAARPTTVPGAGKGCGVPGVHASIQHSSLLPRPPSPRVSTSAPAVAPPGRLRLQPVKRTKKRSKLKIRERPSKASPYKFSKSKVQTPACRTKGDSDADFDEDLRCGNAPLVVRRHHCRVPLLDSSAFTAIRSLGLMSARVADKDTYATDESTGIKPPDARLGQIQIW
jgi:Ca2+-binding EF-hand superfamily protein